MKSKGDWTYGLVVGDSVYSLAGDNKQFEAFAGGRVKVTGEAAGTKIAVQTGCEVRHCGPVVLEPRATRSSSVTGPCDSNHARLRHQSATLILALG